ncbi:MAG: rhodanese-like domain-containing protein [Desulfobulbaceae bacterium]|nr:rhodanese-like domain-containing protein [Desulfobulbaceae bacterium]
MQHKKLAPAVVLLAALALPTMTMAQGEARPTMAKLCGSCHQQQPGLMMGFLENISTKSKIIQMDLMSHKEVVKYNDQTTIKYVDSFEDIRNYQGKGFQVNFVEQNGDKIAKEVIRFDILKAIGDDEKLAKEEFKKLLMDPRVKVYDVRPPAAYQMAHIAGAGMMPAPAFDKFVGKLPQDKNTPIVFYGVGGCLSPTAAMKTKSLGYTSVKIYTGGYPDWVKSETGVTEGEWLKTAIAQEDPHVLIDLRNPAEVKKGHIKGAVGIEAAKLAASKAMFPANKMAPIIVYGPDSDKAATTIHSWGYKKVQVLAMDVTTWQAAGNPMESGATATKIAYTPKAKPGTISLEEFKKAAKTHPASMVLVDVRNPDECATGMIASSINIPADLIGQRLSEIPADKEILLYCNTGARAEMAHTLVAGSGRKSRYLDAMVHVAGKTFTVEEK